MSKLKYCTFGGNKACEQQGGDGSLAHASGYVHPYPHASELGEPVEAPDSISKALNQPADRVVFLEGLDFGFDDDLSQQLLNTEITEVITKGGVHEIDLFSTAGIDAFLELLNIMDPEIINEVYEECFPGYPVENLSPRVARIEIRAFLLDFVEDGGQLDDPGTETTTGIPDPEADAGEPEDNAPPVDEAGIDEGGGEEPPEEPDSV